MSPRRRQRRGLFVAFEGPDGAGKTTQSRRLLDRLLEHGYDALWTREPGGTHLGDLVREVVLHDPTTSQLSPRAEALLLAAARSQHVDEVIAPALDSGSIVVCDRFKDSTTAYQGGGSGLDIDAIKFLNRFATRGLEPDLVVLLDLDVAEGLRRKHNPTEEGASGVTRLELRGADFHNRVRLEFLRLADGSPDRWLKLDAELPPAELGDTIWRRVCQELGKRDVSPPSAGRTEGPL